MSSNLTAPTIFILSHANTPMKLSRGNRGLIFMICVGLVMVCLVQTPQANRATLTIRFAGITNDVSGTKLAVFALSNTGTASVEVVLPAEIELRNIARPDPGRIVFATRLSPSSQPLTVNVVVPENQGEWRAEFSYYPLSPRDRFSRLAASFEIQIPRPPRVTTTVYSEWMNSVVQLKWIAR